MSRYVMAGLFASLFLSACGGGPPPQGNPYGVDSFVEEYYAARGITEETHGTFSTTAYFTPADTPRTPPSRESRWSGNGLGLLVAHSQGHSTVEVLYPVNAHQTYKSSGRGAAIPIEVRINPPADPSARYPRNVFRRLKTDQTYIFSGRLYAKTNRDAAIQLAQEVATKTHCRGGTLTKNTEEGDFAQAYAPRNRAANGRDVAPGWIISYRCSRWRKT